MKKTIKVEGKEVEIDIDIKDVVAEVNRFLSNQKVNKLFRTKKGDRYPDYELQFMNEESVPIQDLKGIEEVTSDFILVSKDLVSVYCKGKIKYDDVITSIPLDRLKRAWELGLREVLVVQKDYPVLCVSGLDSGITDECEIFIVAPKVHEEKRSKKYDDKKIGVGV